MMLLRETWFIRRGRVSKGAASLSQSMIVTTLAARPFLNVSEEAERATFLAAPNTTAAVLRTTMMGMVMVANLAP